MRKAERQLYGIIVRLHPAAFRDEFGRDMLLDFLELEDAASHLGFARLCADALFSVARQWALCDYERPCETRSPLLAGQYAMVRDQHLNALEWSRGLLASTALLGLCAYSLGAGAHIPRNSGIAYAAMQAAAAAQTEAAPSQSSAPATKPHKEFTEFDVATIRENKSGTMHLSFPMSPDDYYVPTHGYMQMIGLPLMSYIQFAYKLNPIQITALTKQMPDWAKSTRYDIEARVEGDPGKDDMRTMVGALLASRFGLKLHAQMQTEDVYDLVLAKPGKLGSTLHQHPEDDPNCKAPMDPAAKDFFSPCGRVGFAVRDRNGQTQRMAGRNISISQFVWYASTEVGRPVVDKTGLSGKYDFALEFWPQRVGGTPDPNAPEPPPGGPIFPDAIRDQMGLKLVSDKGPVTTYVLDHIEKPSEN